MNSSKKYAAEFLGTLVLVFIGCGSAVIAGTEISFFGISFAFGLAVLTMVYVIGNISGCHINPAITIAMLTAGKISGKESAGYIISQCLGAIAGAGILLMIAKGIPGYSLETNGLGQNGFGEFSPMKYSMEAGFIAEVVLTFIFLLVIFGSTSEDAPKGFAGIAIGLSLVMIHLVGIPVTGTSVNPARSLGPALFVGAKAIGQLWMFWIAPIIGGVIAALVWKNLLAKK